MRATPYIAVCCLAGCVAAAYCLPASGAVAESSYPSRPVRLILPIAPGGGLDFIGRTFAQRLTEAWGQTVVVDNRSGAGGIIGADLAAKAPPDGYTLLLSHVTPIAVSGSLTKLPYDPLKDLLPVTQLATAQNLLTVNPSLPARSVRELISLAKSRPGQLRYATGGNGSSMHTSAELFGMMAGVKMTHVPYKGAAPALIDLIGGQVELSFVSIPSVMTQVKTGKVRPLAVTGSSRSQVFPDLPTVAEAALPGYDSTQWYGVFAPAKTPARTIEAVQQGFLAAVKRADVRERLVASGYDLVGSGREEFGRFVKQEIAKWSNVVRTAGIRAD